jgi:ADP-ribosylglycohydrolase
MLGVFAGDVIGSAWEGSGEKRLEFPLFTEFSRYTDDSVMTAAVAHALLEGADYASTMRQFGRRHPFAGYGGHFERWLIDTTMEPYGSYGNGGAMRASPIGRVSQSVEEALAEAARSAMPTHGHVEGVKGAQAVALAVFLARTGATKDAIRREVESRVGYDLSRPLEEIRAQHAFSVEASRSVPDAIASFLHASDFEAAVRNAISLGGDADTMACIAGAIAEAFWGEVPPAIAAEVRARVAEDLLEVQARFDARYPLSRRIA